LSQFERKVKDCFEKVQEHILRDEIKEDLENLRPQVEEQREWLGMLEELEREVQGGVED